MRKRSVPVGDLTSPTRPPPAPPPSSSLCRFPCSYAGVSARFDGASSFSRRTDSLLRLPPLLLPLLLPPDLHSLIMAPPPGPQLRRCAESGMVAHIPKPLNLASLSVLESFIAQEGKEHGD